MNPHMFMRFGNRDAVDKALALLAEFDPRVEDNGMVITVYAPDGDIVFQAIQGNDRFWVCLYHDEVFDRGYPGWRGTVHGTVPKRNRKRKETLMDERARAEQDAKEQRDFDILGLWANNDGED